MSVAAGVIIAWPSTAAAIPTGWTRTTALDAYHVRGAATGVNPGTTGGLSNHAHAQAGHSHAGSAHTHATVGTGAADTSTGTHLGFSSPSVNVNQGHVHNAATGTSSSSTSGTTGTDTTAWPTALNDPAYLSVIWIQSDGTPPGIPNAAVTYFNSATLPTGWSQHASLHAAYMKGAQAGADGGATGGTNTHTHTALSHSHVGSASHTHTNTLLAPNVPLAQNSVGSSANGSDSTHTHTQTLTAPTDEVISAGSTSASTSTALEPPYYTLVGIQNGTGGTSLPPNIIGLWIGTLASIPAGWVLCNGSSSTPDMRTQFARSANVLTDIGLTGGSTATHTHTGDTGHVHSDAHSHAEVTSSTTAPLGFVSGGGSVIPDAATHAHSSIGPAGTATPATATGTAPLSTSATETRPPFYDVAFIQYQQTTTVAVTTPTAGGTSTTPELNAAWLISGSLAQVSYRAQIASDAGMTTVLYDSGLIASAAQSATLPPIPPGPPYPSGYGLQNGSTYYFQVTVVDQNAATSVSPVTMFTASWSTLGAPSALTVTADTTTLPKLHLSWTQAVPASGDTFVNYNVYRRVSGSGATWTRIAIIASLIITTYDDANAEPGISYDYQVTASYVRSGAALESGPSNIASATLTFTGIFIHDATDPTHWMKWLGNAAALTQQQEQTVVQTWGLPRPIVYVGTAENVLYALTGANDVPYTNRANWLGLSPLVTRQRTNGSTLHLRNGITNESDFVVAGPGSTNLAAAALQRKDTLTLTATTVTLVAVAYSELV